MYRDLLKDVPIKIYTPKEVGIAEEPEETGKSFEENYPLLGGFDEFQQLGFPLLAGTSRKSFIGRALARDGKDAPPDGRLYGSLAAMVITIIKGAHIVRVHDVKPAVEAARLVDKCGI